MIDRISDETTLLAIIIRAEYKNEGIEFFTPDFFSQQLAYMNRPAGYKVMPHTHKISERAISLTQEVLYIKTGKVKICLFNHSHVSIAEKILQPGDVILLASGGHALEMLEESEIIEIKQGPYNGEEDKVIFTPQ